MKTLFYSLFAAGLLLFAACSSDVEEMTTHNEDRTLHTATLRFEGDIQRFDAQTRAATSAWKDGEKIYIQFQTDEGRVDGKAVYNSQTGEWKMNYYGVITKGELNKCKVYYFEGQETDNSEEISISHLAAPYEDSLATYFFNDGSITLKAHLAPMTGRIRFRGPVGCTFTLSGMKWSNRYDVINDSLWQIGSYFTLTVGSDGFTPYVYTSFIDDSARQLLVEDEDNKLYCYKRFDTSVLAKGKSGFVDIPTKDDSNGWRSVTNVERIFMVGGVLFKMIKVEAGTFQMGSEDGEDDEKPVHQVTLTKDYFMGETEVTQALWYAVMGQSPAKGRQWSTSYGMGDNYPAYYISYDDCQNFLMKFNYITGSQFRLPTEAEWEFAAHGGNQSKGYIYAGSNKANEVADYIEGYYSATPANSVKALLANELGFYQMSGNVWEWCADWYDENYYANTSNTNPMGPDIGTNRVIRGGGIGAKNGEKDCRVANRWSLSPSSYTARIGFRLAL